MDDSSVLAARRQHEMMARCEEANARAAEAVRRAETALATARDRLRRAQATIEAISEMTADVPPDRADSA